MLFLCKIHKAKYIEDMYENEYLYFGSLLDFRSTEKDESGRFDPKELNLKNKQIDWLTIKVDSKEIHLHDVLKDFKGQYMEHLTNPKINCCSLHWLEIEPNQLASTYHQKLKMMGDKMLFVFDYAKFFEMLDLSIAKLGLEYSRKKVTYYDPKKFEGELDLHHKDMKFSYQNEYRILVFPTDNKPLKLNLPGLKKISAVIETKEYKDLTIEIRQN